jgi:membrane-associated phospholipid phosphatase
MIERLLVLDAAARTWATIHHAAWADFLMAALSLAGQRGLVWMVIGATAAIRRPRLGPLLWQLVLAIVLAHVTVDVVLKPALARSRPFDAILDARVVGARPTTYSFPSGHAAAAAAGAFVTSLMLPRAGALLWLLAALIAISRVYVGVHYPLDVIAGAALGAGVAVLVTGGRAWYIQASSAAQDQWRGSSVGRAPD